MTTGHQIHPFFIRRYGDSDDDHWTTDGMPGMISSRNCRIKSNGIKGGNVAPKRNAVGIIKRMKKEKKNGAHLRDFMNATSMHGLKYAAEKEATWIER